VILADTSIWIEFLKGNKDIFTLMMFETKRNNILVSEVIFGELLQGAKNNREVQIISAYYENLPQVLVQKLWIKAGLYSSTHKSLAKGVGLIDVAIYISAKEHAAKIWTLDKKLKAMLNKDEIAY
jgi:predicted nucleic acid-binding protein